MKERNDDENCRNKTSSKHLNSISKNYQGSKLNDHTFDNINSEVIENLLKTTAPRVVICSSKNEDCAINLPEENKSRDTLYTWGNGFQMANIAPTEECAFINPGDQMQNQNYFPPPDTFMIESCQMTDV